MCSIIVPLESADAAIAHSRIAPKSAATIRNTVVPWAHYVEQRLVVGSLILMSSAYFYATISRSIVDHLWMDEIFAVTAARQVSLHQVWNVIWAGTDFSPPTYHFFLHGLAKMVGAGTGRLIWRVPSIAAIYGAAWCTYILVVRSGISRLCAVVAFGLVFSLDLFEFAVEARQYALLALCLSLALLIWSNIEGTRGNRAKAFCLWFVLAVSLCLHFYGLVLIGTIAVAELIYGFSRRRSRVAVWMALLCTAPVQVAWYPLAAHLAAFNHSDALAPAYYAKPTLDRFFRAVFDVINGGTFGLLLLLSGLATFGLVHFLKRPVQRSRQGKKSISPETSSQLSTIEIAMISLCLLPFVTFAFSLLVTNSFSERYISGAALFPAIAVAYLLDKMESRRTVALVLIPLITGITLIQWRAPDHTADALAVARSAKLPLPIVVGEALLYIEVMQAAESDTRARFVYLTRPEGVASPDPTNENELIRLIPFHPEYRVSEQAAFLKVNPNFYVLQRPKKTTDTTSPILAETELLGSVVGSKRGVLLVRASSRKYNSVRAGK